MKFLSWLIALLSGMLFLFNCNTGSSPESPDQKPVLNVSAGPDDTVYLNESIYLSGTFADSGKPDSLVTIAWRQVSGPAKASIYDSLSKISQVVFTQTGAYVFRFTVSYQAHTETDSASYMVLDSIPFMVLSPKTGDSIVIGDSTMIMWQVVPPPIQALILLSINNGKTYDIQLNPANTSVKNVTQWMWKVDSNLAPSDSCKVRIQHYSKKTYFAVSGRFSLIKRGM